MEAVLEIDIYKDKHKQLEYCLNICDWEESELAEQQPGFLRGFISIRLCREGGTLQRPGFSSFENSTCRTAAPLNLQRYPQHSAGQGATTCAKMVWTIWVPIPRIYVARDHRKLLAGLQAPYCLLSLTPTSRGQHSHSSLARHKERHEANQHPEEPAYGSCITRTDTGQGQSSGLSVVACSSAHVQTPTPSFAPLNTSTAFTESLQQRG